MVNCPFAENMQTEQVRNRISELRDIINEANRRYYVDNAPSLSDYEFDILLKELESLEKEYPEFASADSPTRRVGSDLKEEGLKKEFDQFPHKYPMLSLANTYDIPEVQAFADRAAKGIGNAFTFSCELKFDGTAICLTYKNGKLARALTRGDGTVGDDVTRNVKYITKTADIATSIARTQIVANILCDFCFMQCHPFIS